MLQNERKQHQADTLDIRGKLTQALADKSYAETYQKVVTHNVEVRVPYEKCHNCDKTVLEKSKADYDRAWKRLNGEFKKRTAVYESAFIGFITYALLVTVFMAVRTQSFINDILVLYQTIWEGTTETIRGILFVGKEAAALSERISNVTASTIIYWLLLIGVIVILFAGIIAIIWFGIRRINNIYRKYCWDGISIMATIISTAIVIFFGDWIKQLLSVNQVVLLLIVQGIYIIIRWYVKGCVENRGYY